MQDLWVMCVIYVREDAEELAIDMLDCGREGLVEFLVWSQCERVG